MQTWPILQSLLLIMLANGAPVVAKRCLGARLAYSLDGGVQLPDGQPLFGSSKTFRGVAAAVVVTAAAAPLLETSATVGALIAALAMLGDLISSFIKRRLKLPPSSQAIGLDQVPESLVPLLVCRNLLGLTVGDVAICVAIFWIGELAVSRLLYALHVRDRPY